MCFAVDMDLNNGSPKFGPPTFHEKLEIIMDNKFADNFNNNNNNNAVMEESIPVQAYNAPQAPGPGGYGAVPQ